MRLAPMPRNKRVKAQDALSLGPFDVQLKLTFYPPDTDMEAEVEREVDGIVARGVAKGLVWGVRGSALERDAGYDICGAFHSKTGRCAVSAARDGKRQNMCRQCGGLPLAATASGPS